MQKQTSNIGEILISDISALAFMDEENAVKNLLTHAIKIEGLEAEIMKRAKAWTEQIRSDKAGYGIEEFLHTYSLNTDEGAALMCLAEALLRIPDARTKDALIQNTLEGKNWEIHTGKSHSWLINFSSWGLFLSGKIIDFGNDPQHYILGLIKKIAAKTGEPIIREALTKAMQFIGKQFIIGETVEEALKNSAPYSDKGYVFSYDILGEGARSDAQAKAYTASYLDSIDIISKTIGANTPIFSAPSISVKLSALHPRYQLTKHSRVMQELLPRLISIIRRAKQAGISVSIDAEESFRLDIEMRILVELLKNQEFTGWNGIGFVLQAYQKRAFYIIDWLEQQAKRYNRIIPLRLVKGAYWDSEIKWSQLNGLPSYPVFTRKEHTDLSYIACANKILSQHGIFYPQFASHNARTISSIAELSKIYGWEKGSFEIQRLHGMGGALHDIAVRDITSRIYAPIGKHKDLLAYLIRRLLENGANSSFIHLLMDNNKTTEGILADPIAITKSNDVFHNPSTPVPQLLYGSQRKNSEGMDFGNEAQLQALLQGIAPFLDAPIPHIEDTAPEEIDNAIISAKDSFKDWSEKSADERASILENCADIIEENKYELIALCIKEAKKTLQASVAEIREAVDFCRYYATSARELLTPTPLLSPTGESNILSLHPRGVFACISPWNFPLAIFIGQVTAALATGNCVIAKPAEQTPAIAKRIVQILYQAGIPQKVLHLIIGTGEIAGARIVADKNISGVVFTGSLETAKKIQQSLAERSRAIVPLIAETGGQNCMIVDSSALLEQAVDDIIISAFDSAGQRCSALRVLYVQEDIADNLLSLLAGAMRELSMGKTLTPDTDIGEVIDDSARDTLLKHIEHMKNTAKFIASTPMPDDISGNFVAPHVFEIDNITELNGEIFGPVLHVIRFKEGSLNKIINEINDTGYGLTFGIHSRIHTNIQFAATNIRAGNIYINRSMIGATVGVQPFGGEGLSGTGFKAGGQHYLLRFLNERCQSNNIASIGGNMALLAGDKK